MKKQIPLVFDSVIVTSPKEQVSESITNARRVHVHAFSKYRNRNGSYISDQIAQILVESAASHAVVGWYDPSSKSWAGHVGPELSNAYGYIEEFVGWEPCLDSDGVTREYATFSVVLFSDYFEASRHIVGANQSMELDPESVDGDWVTLDGEEVFVFSKAKIYSFCVIGTKEPCFSASSFFTLNPAQYQKIQSLAFELHQEVDKALNTQTGGNVAMGEELLQNETIEETKDDAIETSEENFEEKTEEEEVVETPAAEEEPAAETFEEESIEEESEEEETEEESAEEETPAVEETIEEEPAAEESVDFEALYNEIKAQYENAQSELEAANSRIAELEGGVADYEAAIDALKAKVSHYELAESEALAAKKVALLETYEKNLSSEEINDIKADAEHLSYDELESKLAIVFSRKQLRDAKPATQVLTIDTTEPDEFALFMANYKRRKG